MGKSLHIDRGLLLVAIFLVGLGVVQVYSSSFIFAIEKYDNGLYFFRKQLIFALAALAIIFASVRLPWRYLKAFGYIGFTASVVGLVATLVPGLGVKVGGAVRWLQLPMGFRIEPSEFFKVFFGFGLAALLIQNWEGKHWFWRLFWPLAVVAPGFVILLKQPDFGSFAILVLVGMGCWFAAGLKWRWVFVAAAAASTSFYYLVMEVPYRKARLLTVLDPWSDPDAKGFQVIQSLLSFYSGGFWGSGLGEGQGKLFFLPEAHTDFTAAVLGEETGFLGILVVLALYGFIVLRGFQISARSKNTQQQIVALAVTLVFAMASFANLGVAMGLFPTKGLALPFLSYGGSSLLASALAVGILLNIDHDQRMQKAKSFRGYRIRS